MRWNDIGRRSVVLGRGQQLGLDGADLHQGRADGQAAQIRPQPAVKWESAAFDAA